MLDVEDERLWNRVVPRRVIGDGDLVLLLFPVGMPGLGFFALPRLLEDRGSVGGELDENDTMPLRRNTATAGVETVELFCGVGEGRESKAQQEERKDGDALAAHGSDRTQRERATITEIFDRCPVLEL